ncbi:NADH-quinone oxidoreductase subunit L [Calidifontibacter sp. DB0510]|uniref:NADH-quinone oxidoreductase subunit L n=1 Tax=Metallococcus carri TaxID=1656884 RepID=A0A967AYA2_9MICO|nr:NADH-quinone oxidoreductase subunit L [Metallococcus carri]NHN55236.1 NADH-quinone oxidoreductase subunit L [Metallococcus carri]NOP36313.1 NADH-quinone oxidoreductase subunit L [Calidifontibacter sp. DB2511S]
MNLQAWPVQPGQLVVLVPAATAVLMVLLARRSNAVNFAIAILGALLGLGAAGLLAAQAARGPLPADLPTIGALPVGPGIAIPLRLHIDHIAVLVTGAVAIVSLTVQAFARWYLFHDPRYRQFAATVALFTAAMQLVVVSDDVLLTLVGWELMGWCSYLLIGHDSEREKARRAAYKAFLVTRFADAPFVVGIAALAVVAQTTSIRAIVQHWSALSGSLTLTAALICIICGVAGKSAQVPFQDWLPDAMEGPTPASALIHAATMVAAGTIVLARFAPLLAGNGTARLVLAISAGLSTVFAAALAFCQHDLKRLLAWSTVSQVGLMLLAIAALRPGVTPDLAVLHLLSHAAFKALLFLVVGWLAVLTGSTVVERLSGAVTDHPRTRRLVAAGLLALAGVPPTMGFVSKDLIVDEALRSAADRDAASVVAALALIIVVPLTAAYAMRAWLVLTHRTVSERYQELDVIDDSRSVREVGLAEMLREAEPVDAHGHALEPAPAPDPEPVDDSPRPPIPTRGLLWVLALVAVFGGVLILSPWLTVDYLHPNWWIVASALMAMAAAAILVRAMALRTVYGDAAARLPRYVRSVASRGLDLDRVYVALVATPVLALARVVARLDGAGERGVAALPGAAERFGRWSETKHRRTPTTGLVAVALGVLVIGLLGVTLW